MGVQSGDLELFSGSGSILAEGPCWSPRANGLFWVDITGKKVRFQSLDGASRAWPMPEKVSAVMECRNGRLVVTLASRVAFFNVGNSKLETLVSLDENPPGYRANDAKCDVYGSLWVGTMDDGQNGTAGRLYLISPDGQRRTLEENIGIPNTLDWDSKRGVFYFGDSAKGVIYRYPCRFEGAEPHLGQRSPFISNKGEGWVPDGSCLDSDGFLWNAQWGGSRVVRYAPDGSIDHIIAVPAPNVTSCCFGGEGGKVLFITTATDQPGVAIPDGELDPEQPGGQVYAVELKVSGGPPNLFGRA